MDMSTMCTSTVLYHSVTAPYENKENPIQRKINLNKDIHNTGNRHTNSPVDSSQAEGKDPVSKIQHT